MNSDQSVDTNNNNTSSSAPNSSSQNQNKKMPEKNGSIDQSNAKSEEETLMEDALKNLTIDDLIRGQTPADIEQRCAKLCADFIGGKWRAAKPGSSDIIVKRISGGMTNQLYRVTLADHVIGRQPDADGARSRDDAAAAAATEPTDVAIKLYQEKHMKSYADGEAERLNDIIVLTIVSHVEIGPRVYGIFNDGVILAYHQHEQFRPKHQQNPKLLRELAAILARIHYLDVPIRKTKHWMFAEMRSMLELGYATKDVPALVAELELSEFQKCDLIEEFAELEQVIGRLREVRVFCHNDFRGSNILVTEPAQKILLCDFEYSSYGPRGLDIAIFLTEWGRDLFEFDKFTMPTDEELSHFIRFYVEGVEAIRPGYAASPENSVAQILLETKLFMLCNFMFFIAFMMKQTEAFIPQIPYSVKTQMQFVNKTYKMYHDIKDQLIKEGVYRVEE